MRPGHVADAACGVVDELRTWPAREAAGCAESSALIQARTVEPTEAGGVLRCTLTGGTTYTIRRREAWERDAAGERRRPWILVAPLDGGVVLDAELRGPLRVYGAGPWMSDVMRLAAAVDEVRRARRKRDPYGLDDILIGTSLDDDNDDGDGE